MSQSGRHTASVPPPNAGTFEGLYGKPKGPFFRPLFRLDVFAMLARWLPAAINTRPAEWSRAAIGMALGTLFSIWVCAQVFGPEVALHLLGPLGASAVLLFAVSSGALAQPWSIVGSYLCASVVALLVARVLGRSLGSACLAAGMALILMCWLRCLHPPSGGLAMTLVLADPASIALGWLEVGPVMLGAGTLLLTALAYNNLTRTRYPKGASEPALVLETRPREVDPKITAVDLEQALAQMEQFFDVTPTELEQLIHIAEDHARRRSIGEVLAERV
ncbi:CBS domain-containing membrane protein [Pseudomonas mucidolens]|uniref:CBS domain-containing membrane protein n=2 Tax=Pseudomonas mucidolens TaxID=46679 RepID=A0A1H2MMS4_9PSED|nr:CBS domain-containing membrane protein [Pseudomonas mucidolens]